MRHHMVVIVFESWTSCLIVSCTYLISNSEIADPGLRTPNPGPRTPPAGNTFWVEMFLIKSDLIFLREVIKEKYFCAFPLKMAFNPYITILSFLIRENYCDGAHEIIMKCQNHTSQNPWFWINFYWNNMKFYE